jgi:hypothetical protein
MSEPKTSADRFAAVKRCIDAVPCENSYYWDKQNARAEIKQAEEREANAAKWFAEHIPAAFYADDPCQCTLCKALREREAKWRELLAAGEKLFQAIGHDVDCKLLLGPNCTCGHAKLQAQALDNWLRAARVKP